MMSPLSAQAEVDVYPFAQAQTLSNVIAIDGGNTHIVTLRNDGTVLNWAKIAVAN